MQRFKPETGEYYVTIGGGIEKDETSRQALVRELKEESGSLINDSTFAFHFEDSEKDKFYLKCSVPPAHGLHYFVDKLTVIEYDESRLILQHS